ncbi:phasin family protein [Sphingomonas montana]|uniref:phasin family protein n=1 Tax=Sphingomonas montana TaxID=1843236 RepID=UPI00096EB9C6|nr:phasin family protein [Sphingomonas montana]
MTDQARTASDAMTGSMKAATDQLKAAGGKAAETSQALNGKILDQAETNVREAFAALRAAATAGSMGDVLKVQGDYVREQSARNMAQAKEIGEMIANFGRTAMDGMSNIPGTPGTDKN